MSAAETEGSGGVPTITISPGSPGAQTQGPAIVQTAGPAIPNPSSSRLQVLSDLHRRLEESDLSSRGVQKLLLDSLYQKEAECERLAEYEKQFHVVDKRVAVQDEKLRAHVSIDVAFGAGVGLGCAIVGLSPTFWDKTDLHGQLCLAIGVALIIAGVAVKLIRELP